MKKIQIRFIITIVYLFSGLYLTAQNDFLPKKAIRYKHLNEKNLVCAKIVTSTITIDTTIIDPPQLIATLYWGIKNKNYGSYLPNIDAFRNVKEENTDSIQLIDGRLGIQGFSQLLGENDDIFLQDYEKIKNYFRSINTYLIQELKFYDGKGYLIQSRLLTLSPIRTYFRDDFSDSIEPMKMIVTCLYYPEIRNYLSNFKIKDGKQTYDDYFMKLKSTSEIQKDYEFDINDNEHETEMNFPISLNEALLEAENHYEKKKIQYVIAHTKSEKFQYPTLIPENVLCAKVVYKKLDLREKSNTVLWMPKYKNQHINQLSLIDILIDAVQTGALKIYAIDDIYNIENFNQELTYQTVKEKLGERIDTVLFETYDDLSWKVLKTDMEPSSVKEYLIKELQFFDKAGKLIQTRISAISPIREFQTDDGDFTRKKQIGWFKFADISPILENHYVYNTNCQKDYTYDEYFKRQIYKSEVFQEKIEDYDIRFIIQNDSLLLYEFPINLNDAFAEASINYNHAPKYIDNQTINKHTVHTAKLITFELDLKKTNNRILWYPYKPIHNYKSLIDLIIENSISKKIHSYSPEDFHTYFKDTIDIETLQKNLGQYVDTVLVQNWDGFELTEVFWLVEYESFNIVKYHIAELQLFDKENKLIQSRIVGICPIRLGYPKDDYNKLNPTEIKVCWIKFNEIRKSLSENFLFESKPLEDQSFLKYFLNKKFESTILEQKNISVEEAFQLLD